MGVVASVFVLGVLIFVHELGHFLVAKFCKVGVLEFAIGFGKKIWKKRFGSTTYSLGVIPLGGYVRMVGDEPHYMQDQALESKEGAALGYEELDQEAKKLFADKSCWFLEKSIAARAAIVFAGPAFNYIFAVLLSIFSIIYYGKSVVVDKPIIGSVLDGFPAAQGGLKEHDLVKSINGKALVKWEDLAGTISASQGQELLFKVQRASESDPQTSSEVELKITGTPDLAELKVLDDNPKDTPEKSYKIGITPETERKPVGLWEGTTLGFYNTYYIAKVSLRGLWGMLRGAISTNNIAGPIFIFKEAAKSAKRGLEHLFDFMVFLSVSLAVLNLLPVPVLDGGHLLFFLIESIRRKPLSIRAQELCNQVGMFLLLGLMVFALGNDLLRLVK